MMVARIIRLRVLFSLVAGLPVALGCGGEEKPRSVEEINAERNSLPALFMTESGKRVEAPKSSSVFLDDSSGELAWPVYECTNPVCPGRGEDESHLFIWTDPRFYVSDEGKMESRNFETIQQWRDAVTEAGSFREPTCEKCLEIRNLASESPEESQKYSEFPRRYVLPHTEKRMKELDAEHQERIDYINRRISGEPS